MNPIAFIEKNIRQALESEGYSRAVAQGGANAAVDEYRRRSQPTVKSQGIYGDCLREAKFYAKHSGEKPVKEKAKTTKGKK
jgi:hypothetical protein